MPNLIDSSNMVFCVNMGVPFSLSSSVVMSHQKSTHLGVTTLKLDGVTDLPV